MLSTRFNRWTIAAVTLAALAAPAAVLAQTPEHTGDNAAQFPSKADLKSLTTSGSYLAARHASVERDAASAAAFYRSALRTDPKNNELLDRAFISSLADGDIDEAVKLADRILTMDKSNRVARLVVGVRDLKQKKYAGRAAQHQPVDPRTDHRSGGDAAVGLGELRRRRCQGGGRNIDKLTGPEWYPIFKDLHTGMILEISGKEKDAGARFERAYKLDDSMLRVSDAYARWLSRNKDGAAATGIYEAFDKKLPRHPLVQEGLRDTKAGKKLPPLVDSAQAGAAEALYGIGATLTRRGGEDLALVYLQLALYLQPNHPLALLSLADLYESVKKPQMAIKVYERMPASSPLKRNAQIQLATNLDAADRSDEAIKILKGVTAEDAEGYRSHHGARQHRARPQEVRRLRRDLYAGDRRDARRDRQEHLGHLLLSRHLRGTFQAVEQGRGRHAQGAGAAARAAACAELSRLFLDRPGHQSRRRHEDDQACRRSAARRRLHRGFARLGVSTASAISRTR